MTTRLCWLVGRVLSELVQDDFRQRAAENQPQPGVYYILVYYILR